MDFILSYWSLDYRTTTPVVQWQNTSLPSMWPGFDSRPAYSFFILSLHFFFVLYIVSRVLHKRKVNAGSSVVEYIVAIDVAWVRFPAGV